MKIIIKDSLKFSEAILKDSPDREAQTSFLKSQEGSVVSFHQIFNKYIIIEFKDEVWVIDQHAAAERVTFEKLSKSVEIKNTDIQNLLVPIEIEITESDIEFLEEYGDIVKHLGFNSEVKKNMLFVKSVPVEFVHADISKLFSDIFLLDINDSKKDLERLKLNMVATMACHTSIRAGQKLDVSLMKNIYYNLLDCDNPYSCPHGRPIIIKVPNRELEKMFYRIQV